MCGIAGLVNYNLSNTVFIVSIKKMLSSIEYRGPDRTDYWVDDKNKIAIGNVRLSIQDLSFLGNQPMSSKSGRYKLVLNGEIYNFKKLKTNFLKDIKQLGGSDTEILLDMIDKYGLDFTLKSLEGMFAFALYDLQYNEVILCRDPIGEKPLYYGWSLKNFLFSSELHSFENLKFFDNEIDYESIDLYLKYNFIPAPNSIYKNIYKLLPGSKLIFNINDKKIKTSKYWYPLDKKKSGQNIKYLDIKQNLKLLLETEVENQLISDAPIGTLLSSGIDSTLVTAIAQIKSKNSINTFTVGFEDTYFNESGSAKKLSEYMGTNHHEEIITDQTILDLSDNIHKFYDEPFADSSQIPTFIISSFAKKKVKVVLSGDGGDELFGGYNKYILTKKYFNLAKKFPNLTKKIFTYFILNQKFCIYLINIYNKIFYKKKISLNFHMLKKLENSFSSKTLIEYYDATISNNNSRNFLLSSDYNFRNLNIYDLNINKKYYDLLDDIEKMMLLDLVFLLPSDMLCKIDRASMSNSLEVRCPLLGKKIVENSINIPLKYKINDDEGKLILKDILKDYLPKYNFTKQKKGFGVPMENWLRTKLLNKIDETFNNSDYASLNLNKISILSFWSDFKNKKNNDYNMIWNVYSLLKWKSKRKFS
jgi:asparagine synthase (glutamine-hydrolysing)